MIPLYFLEVKLFPRLVEYYGTVEWQITIFFKKVLKTGKLGILNDSERSCS